MRALVAGLVGLAALVTPGPASSLGSCVATADTPTAPHAFSAEAHGGFWCEAARPSMEVVVCLEVLDTNLWEPVACETASATDVASVEASAYGCRYGLYLIRTTARGTASTGETAEAASIPTAYFCTPL